MNSRARITTVLVSTFILSGTLGCQPPESDAPTASPAVTEPPAPTPPQVTLEVADAERLQAAIDAQRGKVVLVDFWATWCLTCVELFPHTVELHERLGDRGLAVISVSLDDPDGQERIRQFLEKHEATMPNFISQFGAGTESMDQFELPGPLPQMKIYDRQGNLVETLPPEGTSLEADQIDTAVEKLLAD